MKSLYSLHTLKASVAAAALMIAWGNCQAVATDVQTFNVKITITSSCDIHTAASTDVNFGSVSSTATNTDQAGALTATCTQNTPYTIALSLGSNATGTQRRMILGTSNYVNYNLYRDAARTLSWGLTTGTDTLAGTGSGAAQTIPVYGRVPSANSPAGNYSDIVTATISY